MQLVRFCFGAVAVLSNIHLELSKISPENAHNWQMITGVFTIKAVATVRRQVEQWFSLNIRRKWCGIWVQGGRACARQIEEGQCLKYTNSGKAKDLVSIRLAVCPILQLEHRTHFPYRSGCLKQSHLKKTYLHCQPQWSTSFLIVFNNRLQQPGVSSCALLDVSVARQLIWSCGFLLQLCTSHLWC